MRPIHDYVASRIVSQEQRLYYVTTLLLSMWPNRKLELSELAKVVNYREMCKLACRGGGLFGAKVRVANGDGSFSPG